MEITHIRIGRKSVPYDVSKRAAKKAKNMTMCCPVCRNPLWGIYELGHVIPVADGGDNLPVRTFVGLHKSCNRRIGRTIVDLTKISSSKIILVKYGKN